MSAPRDQRVLELSRMTKGQLRIEEQRVMEAKGMRRVWGGPGSKDELISSILYLEQSS